MQTNTTQNNASNPTQGSLPSYGGMDQVCSGPAGMLYSLSNQLITIYNDLQTLYGKVAVAETNVQQSTITASAIAQRDAANQQSFTIVGQAIESGIGAAVSIGTMVGENLVTKGIDDQIGNAEGKLSPLKELESLEPGAPIAAHMIGDPGILPATSIATRTTALKNGTYDFGETPQVAKINNQKAIDQMTPQEFTDFKKALNTKISAGESNVNTLQSRRTYVQNRANTFGQMTTGAVNGSLKGWESVTTAAAGNAQAQVQVANGVQGMANSTADAARGSIGQDYAKVSDVIAAARQGAQAYAQT